MKKVLPIILSIVVIVSVFATVVFSSNATDASPNYYVSGDYTYYVVGSTDAVVSGYSGADAEITIPEKLDDYKVTSIDDFAFMAIDTLTGVTIPSTIVRVGEYAFFESPLATVTFMNAECEIFDSEFTIYESTVIRGYDNSTAYDYAVKYERAFESLGDTPVTPTNAPVTEATQPTVLPSETVAPTEVTPTETQPSTEVAPTETQTPSQPQYVIGDVDGDGEVSIMDATAIQLHIAEVVLIEEDKLSAADADRDGDIYIMDATQIQLFVAQLIYSL